MGRERRVDVNMRSGRKQDGDGWVVTKSSFSQTASPALRYAHLFVPGDALLLLHNFRTNDNKEESCSLASQSRERSKNFPFWFQADSHAIAD